MFIKNNNTKNNHQVHQESVLGPLLFINNNHQVHQESVLGPLLFIIELIVTKTETLRRAMEGIAF